MKKAARYAYILVSVAVHAAGVGLIVLGYRANQAAIAARTAEQARSLPGLLDNAIPSLMMFFTGFGLIVTWRALVRAVRNARAQRAQVRA